MTLPYRLLLTLIGAVLLWPALAQNLPPEVEAALARAKVPREAVALLVVDAAGKAPARLSHRASALMNPASVMKLVTTYAALDLLGPAYQWRTPVYLDGAVKGGTLFGNLYIKGQGDPKLVAERLWLLLRRVQGLGIQKIAGDIVLDQSAFAPLDFDPASFDGEPLRPYNAAPEALLINFKTIVMTFVPDLAANTASVQYEPALAGVQMQASVPLASAPTGTNGMGAACGDYRTALKGDFSDPTRIRFAGSYPASCLEKVWALAYADPASYGTRAVAGLWQQMGGQLSGSVRSGAVPPSMLGLPPTFDIASPPLGEVIRDINKYSNNVMAQQVFLTLSLAQQAPATPAASREALQRWWQARIGTRDAPLLDNGSGLSRQERISAQALARLLQTAWASPLMPELMNSLPIAGVDGTLKRSRAQSMGRAHLKTGSLNGVLAVAGYVHAPSGKRYVLVALINHANANAARPALEALLDWTVGDNGVHGPD
ncbi:MAG: D-alanyl-D-alanine carboxypeptidase/D-alanyl-D-alanine-endopeptidase [Gammaproteobacteria bacterium]|uniref:D-alanyl-D-alanine carboxypeptidase/D-alanyl-D-alanine endopeptidase n=1 Tax=Rhodoferax sp. TaxID=50421 RepID=UPI001D71D1C0|nr:D-alanyl-D-alanine carboxypeptidase/D-alanyl-D-alanine-endopeptidase [Rhodoferax sp.]MBU3897459.1 D-alanyl-D-alanine carboxypeptidase/D-alanyl-D-alanine-endopeptidase [Gammaproteobacteria bacterium]MBU3998506.1 D-alanyl-D-alanine carboxypeptidase/D-alanyl-D-alanine-endopeptidase [Gammaproteobacteria bacterium]MBU4018805.1 D-alanyl-D-alanine carboxypeptidase/D-alanyl-D-alanine-endopeptidase [Gammaproteobacteria bacterium]MBU4079760.1 D-alanyl-D-alanine carboxypeptidase/D-alanyl-D-alanine-endo